MQNYEQAAAHIHALTGDINSIVDLRFIHDTNKAVPGIPRRGRLADLWVELTQWNNQGYGAFIIVNETDGQGRKLENFTRVRAHFADLDDPNYASQSLNVAANMFPAPSFWVNTSPGKAHVYWPSVAYNDHETFDLIQAKLIAHLNGDTNARDLARILRLSGTLNCKYETPHLVTCAPLNGYGFVSSPDQLLQALQHVQVAAFTNGGRQELGAEKHRAPSFELAKMALFDVDPNDLDRGEWITCTSAFKQAAWSLADPDTVHAAWSEWCARYVGNDAAENAKQWDSIRNTEVGWNNLSRRSPTARALANGFKPGQHVMPIAFENGAVVYPERNVAPVGAVAEVPPMPTDPDGAENGQALLNEMLMAHEYAQYFDGCFFVTKFGNILTPSGRMLAPGQFNGVFGGKKFIIDNNGQVTDEPWKAATRSTVWRVPVVDHTRFVPSEPTGKLLSDALGRIGVNTYRPSKITSAPGDVTPFLHHLGLLFPVETDRRSYLEFLAHSVKFPGYKIPWAPVLISVEGAGKGLLKELIMHAIGKPRCYSPNAQELVSSGSKFNAWMREKLFIIVDEIKVDERRELVEILKPMITDHEIEIQAKGVDQDIEDNYANWQFHSNYKDAIPVNKNGRRYAIFYLAPQTAADLVRLGMDDRYFSFFANWINNGGKDFVAHYLLNYPIERGAIPHRAPFTTSTAEAIDLTRGGVERTIHDQIAQGKPGFLNGWISMLQVKKLLTRNSPASIETSLGAMGYIKIGYAPRMYRQESASDIAELWSTFAGANVHDYGRSQGYE